MTLYADFITIVFTKKIWKKTLEVTFSRSTTAPAKGRKNQKVCWCADVGCVSGSQDQICFEIIQKFIQRQCHWKSLQPCIKSRADFTARVLGNKIYHIFKWKKCFRTCWAFTNICLYLWGILLLKSRKGSFCIVSEHFKLPERKAGLGEAVSFFSCVVLWQTAERGLRTLLFCDHDCKDKARNTCCVDSWEKRLINSSFHSVEKEMFSRRRADARENRCVTLLQDEHPLTWGLLERAFN